ncbi:hypothetical protein SAMN06269185_2478 [Natronoarchaeum philippinense]|uniref:Sulfatase n=1 Tax=Natronoarchaeum philippinense TaxID=558529 RepID=A0A285P104_NATPI|nr:hypothetical protein [Natronoarchaeum philippinense]SNZ15405.1 hypothetical protein SAMN06269185_2478 [Natronoarchaeum philippinense]
MKIPDRYSLENLLTALKRPSLVLSEANALGTKLNINLQDKLNYPSGTDIPGRDWDNLIILDGCRYDMYAEHCNIEGELEKCRSSGSESWEFLQNNFQGEQHHDTVYVTANPHAPKLDSDTFHAVENLLDEYWDAEHQTVRPEDVADAAIEIYQEYPDKRLIVHFMQPHFPFIGDTGDDLEHKGIDLHREGRESTDAQVWMNLKYNRADKELVWKAYRENLEVVLPHAERVMESIPGKTVITSDHGNLLGERTGPIPARGYGHPRGLHAEELREVPWHVIESSERRSITADPPVNSEDLDSEIVEQRLDNLGYK